MRRLPRLQGRRGRRPPPPRPSSRPNRRPRRPRNSSSNTIGTRSTPTRRAANAAGDDSSRPTGGLLAASVAVLVWLHVHYSNLAATPYDLVVLGQRELLASTNGSVRVVLRDAQDARRRSPTCRSRCSWSIAPTTRPPTSPRSPPTPTAAAQPRFTLPDWADADLRPASSTPRTAGAAGNVRPDSDAQAILQGDAQHRQAGLPARPDDPRPRPRPAPARPAPGRRPDRHLFRRRSEGQRRLQAGGQNEPLRHHRRRLPARYGDPGRAVHRPLQDRRRGEPACGGGARSTSCPSSR